MIRDQIEEIVKCLDKIREISSSEDFIKSGTTDTLNKIGTIPDLFNDDRLTETIIYIESFYNLS